MTQPLPKTTPATTLVLPLMVLLAALLASSFHGCGPNLSEHVTDEDRMHAEVRKRALTITSPGVVHIEAGKAKNVSFEVTLAPGFYVPARHEPDRTLLGTWLEPPRRSFARVDKLSYPQGHMVDLPSRSRPVLAYDGKLKIGLHLSVHRNVNPRRYVMPFVLHYQLCTVRGCEVPERRTIRVSFEVAPAKKKGNLGELSPP
ncbi:MAG: hypothetical protein KC502_22280 [Myxococcales bacterium]|nr:hypothetical protein [Myxococcales bacterium]